MSNDSSVVYASADVLIRNVKVFNNDELPVVQDVAIAEGKILARGKDLEVKSPEKVVDGEGLWAMPGLFDIHTHYDLELEVAPGLPESTRHGTTTVVIANCSLGLAYGNQREDDVDPIVDCYARVENIPKPVLRACADKVTWNDPKAYLDHLDAKSLGPNVITMIPHSMLRIEAMGFNASITRQPSQAEITNMQNMLREGLKMGYAGFSTDSLPFHYLANQPNTHKTIPTQFAKYDEIKQLTDIVRDEDSVWQATPPKDNPLAVIKTFLLTSAKLHGKPLKTTVVAALDMATNRNLVNLARVLAKVLNSKFLQGKFYMQALAAPFKVWADGAVTPVAEEIPELRALNETDLEDREARRRILQDPEYIKIFRAMWMKGKAGFGPARIRRLLRLENYAFDRDMSRMTIDICEQKNWQGKTFLQVFDRVCSYKVGTNINDFTDEEKELIERDFFWVSDEADFVIQMLRTFDNGISWHTVTANRDMKTVRELLMDPLLLPGFNDSGAHLTNMAFYDCNLRALKLAAEGGDKDLAYMVKRLTKDPAEIFNVDRGTINVGDVADLILVDPAALNAYDGEANVQRIYREEYQHQQLVNRSDGVVPMVLINGDIVWESDNFTSELGQKRFGSLLRPRLKATG